MLRTLLLATSLVLIALAPPAAAQDADPQADAEQVAADAEQAAGDAAQAADDAAGADQAADAAPERLFEAPKSADEALGMVQGWIEDGKRWVEEEGGAALVSLIVFVIVLLVFWILAGVLARITRRALSTGKFNASDLLKDFAHGTVRKIVLLIGLIIALDTLGVPVAPLVAGIGVVGFVVGFALQDTLGNFAAGIMILLYRPFDVGQFVEAGGVSGTVVNMTLVSTTFKTLDNQKVIVPNGSIWGGTITNYAANPTRRIDLTIGVSYSDDLDKVQKVLEEIITSHEKVLKDPEPTVLVTGLGDSSVNFSVRPWTATTDWWGTRCALIKQIKQRFDAEGISIPFPQRDVHLFQES